MDKNAASRGATGDAPIFLKLLGDMRVTVAGETDATPRSKRARGLVAYLAFSRDHNAQRARLADLFWGDRGESQARGSLRQCLLEVRRSAGAAGADFLISGRESVSLGGAWSSDVFGIEERLQSQDAVVVADGFDLAGHEALAGDLFVNDDFDEWLNIARAEFDRKLAEAARRGLRLAIETGNGDAARRIADQYLARDPGDEEVTVLAMQADVQRGAAPVAHRRFQKLRDFLASEYGTVPGTAAYDALGVLTTRAPAGTETVLVSGSASGPPVLIIGPFEDTGIAAELGHLVAGIREEVASGLSRFRDLRVLVENTVPNAGDVTLYEGGGASYVLTVSLRQGPSGIRVTPVLRRLSDRAVVWSYQIALDRHDLQQAIDTIVDRIIGAVAPRLERDAIPRANSGQVYDRYLLAKQTVLSPQSTFQQINAAAEELESILVEAPDLTVAYGPLIRIYNTHFGFTVAGEAFEGLRDRAFTLTQTALALDRAHVHNYTLMGWCHLWRGNWDAARAQFHQALQLNPYHAERIKEAAFGMIFLGDHDEGDTCLRRCLELDPLPNDNFFEDLGALRLLQGKPEEAVSYLDLVAEPTIFAEFYGVLAACAIGRKTAAAAAAAWRKRIEARWTTASVMTNDALLDWLKIHLPFRRDEDWQRIEGYYRTALR